MDGVIFHGKNPPRSLAVATWKSKSAYYYLAL